MLCDFSEFIWKINNNLANSEFTEQSCDLKISYFFCQSRVKKEINNNDNLDFYENIFDELD